MRSADPGRYGPWLEPIRQTVHERLERLHPWLRDFLIFGFKQGWACLFGGVMLGLILVTKFVWQPDWALARYDFLFLAALAIQGLLLLFKLENWDEAKVIFLFHVVGTVMEIFKTSVGSWIYPEASWFRIAGVPLFSGFMYSCVGSYIARIWRIFDVRFAHYPPIWMTWMLSVAIYINFFSHHYIWDFRYVLFAATALIFWRTRFYFTPHRAQYWMPIILGFVLVSLFIWFAENIGTFANAWVYPHQQGQEWHMVSPQKLGAWLLLMIISFVLVTVVHKPEER